MEVIKLDFEDGQPARITISMSVYEAALLTRLTGGFSASGPNEAPRNSYPATSELYGVFTDGVFNRYWDDGVDDYFREQ